MIQWKQRGALLSQDLIIVPESHNMTETIVDYRVFVETIFLDEVLFSLAPCALLKKIQ